MNENQYQTTLIRRLKYRFPGCVIVKNDSSYQQGFPDLTIFYGRCWAALEVKASIGARRQANQDHFISVLDELSFAAFICPENEGDVLNALQRTFRSSERACISES